MENELWSIVFKFQGPNGLKGVGIHTANVLTSKPQLKTEEDLMEYKNSF